MGHSIHEFQTTLKTAIMLSGVGVHCGDAVTVQIQPADADTGIVFHRLMQNGSTKEIRGLVSEIGAADLCTVLGNPSEANVATVEHLMAALYGLGIDNAIIEVDGPEIPILDGSAATFVDAIDQVGLRALPVKRHYIRVLKPVRAQNGASWAEFRPHNGTRFEVEIDFESPAIGRQWFAGELSPDVFRREISRARTFGFMKDVERLWAAGYALGSSLENSVVIGDDHTVINMEGLRYEDEFVRHKTLDAVGDLALAGACFIGCFRSYRGGHRLNAQALRALLSDRSAFEIVETGGRVDGRRAELVAVNAPVYAPWTI